MLDYIPAQIDLPVKYNVFNLHYQRIEALIIDKHTKKIQKLCAEKGSSLFEKLSTDLFWIELKKKSENPSKVDALHNEWLQLKPLAHLNSKQLISLYQDHIVSLERCYQYLITQFPEKSVEEQLISNLECLNNLKRHILDGLWYRAKVHIVLGSARNVDDVFASLCTKINELNVLETPLTIPTEFSSTLDDDRRLFIFDLLKKAKIDEDTLHDEILSSIPKRGHFFIKNTR